MKIALAQIAVSGSLETNLGVAIGEIAAAARRGADVVLFPETALTGYLGFGLERLSDLSPRAVQEAVWMIQDHCRAHGVAAVTGQYVKRCGRWYNNAVAISRTGALLASYDKCQLVDQDCYEITPGDSFPVFELDGVRGSIGICHDVRYPEILRQYGAQRSQVHFHLFYGMRNGADLWHQEQYDAHLITRAVENGFILAAANAVGNEQMVRSQVRDPEGRSLAKARSWMAERIDAVVAAEQAGDGWARKRRDDLFPDPVRSVPARSYFERGVWERKPYMIDHDAALLAGDGRTA